MVTSQRNSLLKNIRTHRLQMKTNSNVLITNVKLFLCRSEDLYCLYITLTFGPFAGGLKLTIAK